MQLLEWHPQRDQWLALILARKNHKEKEMAAPIFAGMAGFADNFTKSYNAAQRRQIDDERQVKMDKILTDRAEREAEDWEKKQNYEKGLADAGSPVKAEQANDVLKDDEGNDMPTAPAFRTSDGQRFTTMAEAQSVADKGNTSDVISARQTAFMRASGKPLEAMKMENAALEQQAKRLGMSIDQLKFADMQTNRALESALKSSPTWYEGATKFATDTQRGGMKDVKAEHELSPDGKSVTLFAVMPDGKRQATGTYATDDSGRLQFMQKFSTLPIERRMDLMLDKIKADKEDSRWQQTFDFNRQKEENDQQYKNRVLGLQASQDRRAAETHKLAMEDAKVPPAVKLQAATYQKQMESVSNALNKAMAEGAFNPENKGTKDLVAEQAALREEYKKLLAPYMPSSEKINAFSADPYGFSKQAPGTAAPAAAPKIKPPTAPVVTMQQVAPIDPGEKPARQANEPLQAFKARLIQWDNSRMAFEDAQQKLQTEAQRKFLLQSRPDLAQMGQGLR